MQRLTDGARTTLVTGGADARYFPTGHLVYALAGVLLAVPFDVDTLSTTGGPVPVVEEVRRGGGTTGGATAVAQFGFSSNGSLVYIPGPVSSAGSGAQTLAIFDRKGQGEPLKLPPAAYSAPRVSPDGKWVAFEIADGKEANVWLWELGGTGAARRLTFGGRNLAPIWSADSQWVAYQSDRDGAPAIFRQRADGAGTAERLTTPDAGAVHIPQTWSPDGEVLLFTLLKEQQYTLSALAMKDRRISTFPVVPSTALVEAAFSPDGRWVAYQSRESGGNAVYLQPFPATGAKFLVPHPGGHPYWSRKGDQITLNIGPGPSAWIPVTTSPRLDFGRPEEFVRLTRSEPNPSATRRNVDALPDGRVVGVMSAAEAQSASVNTPQIIVVLNWFDELRQRVPVP